MMTVHRFCFQKYGIALLAALVLLVTALPGRAAAPVAFTSAYTDLNRSCRYDNTEASEGSDAPMYCTGYGNYRLLVSFSAFAADIFVESRNQSFSRLLAEGQASDYTREKGRKAEWRLADGKPFAVILRAFTYRTGPDDTPDFSRKVGERLVIKGLAGFEHIDFTVDARATPNANVRARQLADDGYSAAGRAGVSW
ncbi:hypothetical protein [Chloracidobacterium thermophilum]|uniref:hypothetical protein n=1 Tax=Chloracidobacterium thermophilum TaxID=458033 RepID=UPI000738D0E2|nr:hypothetical protein [Chloracidobacterium thermophilum]